MTASFGTRACRSHPCRGSTSNSRVIYIGTFSKVLFPSLRVGYIVIPSDLVERFHAIRRVMDLGPPSFYQEVLSDFIREGHFARHIRRMRVHYRELRSALVANLRRELGPLVEVLGDEAGMHVTVTLQNGSRDLEIAERAARLNLSVGRSLLPTWARRRARASSWVLAVLG